MTGDEQRAALQRLIEKNGSDYKGLSLLLGRNASYVQQFIRRRTPRELDTADVVKLARFYGVDPVDLGGPSDAATRPRMVQVPRFDVRASAGHGAIADEDGADAHMNFEAGWLRSLSGSDISSLSFIRVQGDSMSPTLADGDDILVDQSSARERVRDGIYVLRRDDTLMVKRIALSPSARHVTIKSDNPAYPEWPNCDLATLEIIGRVVWAGRRVS